MKSGIRFKLLAIILLSCLLPLALGIASIEYFGYHYYARTRGQLYQSSATQLAQNISLTTGAQIEKISDWTQLSRLADQVRRPSRLGTSSIASHIEKAWPQLSPQQAPLRSILQNDLSRQLREFQKLNPLFTEIFVTDARGAVIAATNKTSDYFQADELWWQKSKAAPPRLVTLQGIAYDESARVHSLDASVNLRDSQNGAFQGVLKAVINASALLASVPRDVSENGATREIVFNDGRVLTRFFDSTFVPLSVRYSDFNLPNAQSQGWAKIDLEAFPEPTATFGPNAQSAISPATSQTQISGETQLIGFAPLQLENAGPKRMAIEGLSPMTVLVREDASLALAPIRDQLLALGLIGGVLLTALSLIGLSIADRKIIGPLRLLGRAARGVAQTARLEENFGPSALAQTAAREAVQHCREINTGDEIETLADDIALMGERVLRYHEQLQKEIAAKTGEIQRDLQMARDFQESLLPREYPQLCGEGDAPETSAPLLRLQFHHIYQPAQTVGGDFFDVFKLSDHQAGIFIADVMGHGARSALVSAILRTLLQDLSSKTSDPAALMRLINLHFFEIMQDSRQFVFVSAFCLVIDVQSRTATYANAGHPSPLVADSSDGSVVPLLGHTTHSLGATHSNGALGLARDTTYQGHSRPVEAGQAFLLFTDGVAEAPNIDGEEFGVARLQEVIGAEMENNKFASRAMDVNSLSQATMTALRDWMQDVPSPDDICLVAVAVGEILSSVPKA